MRSWNVQKHGLYRLGQYRMCLLRSGHDVQHDHERCLVYGLYHVCYWNLCVHGLYHIGKSGLYSLRRWNVL